MPTSCSAFGCSNHNMKKECIEKGISFHSFPLSNPELLKQWLVKIRRKNFVPNKYTRICSDHFEEDCFSYQPFTNRRFLKSTAIPTKFVFNVEKPSKRKRTSYTVGETLKENHTVDNFVLAECQASCSNASSQTDLSFITVIDKLSTNEEEINSLKSLLKEYKFSANNIKLHSTMKCLTSFTYEQFNAIFNFLCLSEELSQSKDEILTAVDQFFLFMVKVRTGITNEFLSILFKISVATVSRIFVKVTKILYIKCRKINIWPSKAQIKEFMPVQFLQSYPECRVIIDCTEIQIQKPFRPIEQQATFSFYKNANTLKALVGISPSGGFTFISDLWCGSISDKALFIKSGLFDLLESGDVVLADRGFTISKELEERNCKLEIPHFLKDKVQFTLNEKIENKKVSSLRVHVERAIGRIKIFNYFEGSIPYTALHNINEVFYVCTFLTNFNNELIKG